MRLAPQEIRTYFGTTVTANRRRMFQIESSADMIMDVLQFYRSQNHFKLHSFVVMPDHIHVLLTPAPDILLEKAVQFIKGNFSFRLKSKREVWERSFNEAQILSAEKFHACRRYIEEHPLRAGLVALRAKYVYSSAFNVNEIDPMPEHFR